MHTSLLLTKGPFVFDMRGHRDRCWITLAPDAVDKLPGPVYGEWLGHFLSEVNPIAKAGASNFLRWASQRRTDYALPITSVRRGPLAPGENRFTLLDDGEEIDNVTEVMVWLLPRPAPRKLPGFPMVAVASAASRRTRRVLTSWPCIPGTDLPDHTVDHILQDLAERRPKHDGFASGDHPISRLRLDYAQQEGVVQELEPVTG